MALTELQREMARVLAQAWAAAGPGARIVHQSEYLGWLPYGQYQWVDVEHAGGREDVSRRFPSGWEREDVLAVEGAGLLRRVSETRDRDESLYQIVYVMTEER